MRPKHDENGEEIKSQNAVTVRPEAIKYKNKYTDSLLPMPPIGSNQWKARFPFDGLTEKRMDFRRHSRETE